MKNDHYYNLKSWSTFDITGVDSKRFLSGQLTSDLSQLPIKGSQLTARVSRTGQLLFFGYLIFQKNNEYKIISPDHLLKDFIVDLEKFVIMDEVEVKKSNEKILIGFKDDVLLGGEYIVNFLGRLSSIKFVLDSDDFPEFNSHQLELGFGLPNISHLKDSKLLINQTVLVDEAVSNDKGCYVGQETVKKIEANRGAGKKAIALEVIEDLPGNYGSVLIDEEEYKILNSWKNHKSSFISIEGKRSLRVQNRQYSIELNGKKYEAKVKLFPVAAESIEKLATDHYEKAVMLFTGGNDDEALKWMALAFKINPKDVEISEAYGALEGRLGNLNKAIEIMDHLEIIDSNSIMAHTNKSLFYMKLGQIEKAEDEKSKATVKSFQNTAKQNTDKKEELSKRLDMFTQVLEIDEDDELANQGSAEIFFEFGELDKSKIHLDRLISNNEKDYKAMALMAKIFIKEGRNSEALELLKKVSLLSGDKGDFVLANETQSLINSLEIPSI